MSDREQLIEEVRAVAQSVLGEAGRDVEAGADLVATLGVDSLTGLRVLAAVEKRLGVRFPDHALAALRSFDAIADAVERIRAEGREAT